MSIRNKMQKAKFQFSAVSSLLKSEAVIQFLPMDLVKLRIDLLPSRKIKMGC